MTTGFRLLLHFSPRLAHASASIAANRWQWTRAVFVLVCALFAFTPLKSTQQFPHKNKDYDLWYRIGCAMVNDAPLYPEAQTGEDYQYMYPPTMAVFVLAPLSLLGYTGFVASLVVANCVAWYLILVLGYRLYAGAVPPQHQLVLLLPFAVSAAYAYDTFLLGQVNLVLLLMMLVMFAALRSGRPWLAGFVLTLAATFKAFPIAALAYLIYRRHWRAVAATLVSLVLLLLVLPAPIRGFERNLEELKTWAKGTLGDQSGNSLGQRKGLGFTYKNQSIIAVVHRLTRHVQVGDLYQSNEYFVNVVDISPRQAQLIGFAVVLGLGLLYLLFMPGRSRQCLTSLRCEEAMLLVLVCVCSPLSWTYFYCWTFPAWVVVIHELTRPDQPAARRRWGWAAVGAIAMVMCSAILHNFMITPLALGATVWGGIGLFLLLGVLMRTESKGAAIGSSGESNLEARPSRPLAW